MIKSRHIFGVIIVCLVAVSGHGQDTPPADAGVEVSVEFAEERIADLVEIQEAGELSNEDQTRLQLYRGALESLRAAEVAQRVRAQFAEQGAQAPVEREAVRAELAVPPAELKPQVPPDATLADLEEALKAAHSELETARTRLRDLEAETVGRETRAGEIRDQIAAAQHDLEEIGASESALPLLDESPALTLARRTKLRADRQAVEAQTALLQEERKNYNARTELLPLKRERWVRRVAQQVKLETAWQAIVDEARAADIREKADEASRAAALAHPLVAPIAEANVELARQRDALQPQLERAQHELAGFTPDPEVLRRLLERLDQKVSVVGMTSTVGLLLRKNREDLPDVRVRRNNIRDRRAKMADLEFERLELEDKSEALIAGQEGMIDGYLAQLGPALPAAERTAIETEIREQFGLQRE